MRRLLLCLNVVFTLLWLDTYAYDKYTTSKITSIEGLSQNDVANIILDKYGFMWIATSDGLCRYDGYEFQVYSIGDYGLQTNIISSVVEDKNGNIWVGTVDKGLYCYQRSKNHFYHYSELIDDNSTVAIRGVRNLTLSEDGTIWGYDTASQALLHIELSRSGERIESIDRFVRGEGGIQVVTSICAAGSKVYFGTYNGLYVYDSEYDNLAEVKCNGSLGAVYYVVARGELLYLSTHDGFVATLDTRSGRVREHNLGIWVSKFLWQDNTIWIVSGNGVYTSEYNSVDDSFSDVEIVDKFPSYYVNDITEDHTGGVWVGLYQAGIRRYEVNKKPFMINQGLGNDQVLSLYHAPLNDIWVSTTRSGIFKLDSLNANVGRGILPYRTIYSIDYAPYNNTIYVATDRTMLRIKVEDDKYLAPEMSLKDNYVRKVLVDSTYLWISLNSRGVLRQNLEDGVYTNITQNTILQSNTVRNIMKDRIGNIWFSTDAGLARIASEERYKSSPKIERVLPNVEENNYAVAMIEASDGRIWYGTLGYGLYSLRKRSAKEREESGTGWYEVSHITTKDGLASNVVKAILEDDNGVIWISTNRGLSSVVLSDNKTVKVNNYNIHNGLQDYEFNEQSAVKLPDGTLAFGGVAGYNYFNPNNFIIDTTQIRPVITDFSLDGESIFSDESLMDVAPDGLYGERGLILNYDQNSFTIKYAGLHFSDPSKNQYKYRLEGVDRRWITSSARVREVTYRNIPPGDYKFYLNAANADGVWARDMLVLNITIRSPFWMTWYAFLLYAILLAVVAYYVMRQIRGEMKRRNLIALADMEKRKMEEMLNMRTRFFTNVSHEFRTPLTLILTPLQRLIDDEQIAANPKWSRQLKTMEHNGDSLMRLVNEFLSYTKHESGGLKVQLSDGNFTEMIQTLFEQFKFWAEQRRIVLQCRVPQKMIMMRYDRYLVEQVIYNLVSNAIKYTPEDGAITLTVEEFDDHVIFSVADTGCGITEEMSPHIFERFYSRVNNDSKEIGGTGIGLFLTKSLVLLHGGEIWFNTEVDRGSTFFVKLPKGVDDNVRAEVGDDEGVSLSTSSYEQEERIEHEVGATPSTLLIVDDNVEILHLLSDIFEERYNIITAKNGEEGWQKAAGQLPDIIISDVMMPKMNGLDLCDKIKSETTTSHIPVILLSAKASNEDISAGLRCSADAYCPKPFNYEVLISTVNSILANRRRLADKYRAVSAVDSDPSPLVVGDDDAITNTDKIFLARLVEYIEANIHNPNLVVNDLCNYMGITPLVLNKKLKSLLNMTANALIRTIRLRRAAVLLKTARYTVADVTYDVGFSDLRYFRECFKKEFGLLPQEYKDQASGESLVGAKHSNSIGDAMIDAAATKYTRTQNERKKESD